MATVFLRPLGPTLAVLLVAGRAFAGTPEPSAAAGDPTGWENAPATRRSGLSVGASLGFGVASVGGYPNDVTKIGNASYHRETGARPAVGPALWVGGALTDWLNVCVGFTGSWLVMPGDGSAKSLGGMFHIEVFPLFYLDDRLRDLGVILEVGAGSVDFTDDQGVKRVDGSVASLLGIGLFWEPVPLRWLRGGPFVMFNDLWSDSAQRPALVGGWRMSLSAGP